MFFVITPDMKSAKEIVLDALATGKLASIATSLAIAACGKAEQNNPVAPLNAISHIAFGEEAARQNEPSLKYTATGILLNDAACTSWAALHEQFFGRAASNGNIPMALTGGSIISLVAYITDYYLVPKRITPGMEKRLSNRSLLFIYTILAMSLALGSLLNAKRKNG
jgi:hypothetical protein